MIKITCEGVVTMPRGAVLKLSAEQAARREWALVPVEGKKAQFEVREPVQFKHGEEFGFLGDPEMLPRALRPERPARKSARSETPEGDAGGAGEGGDGDAGGDTGGDAVTGGDAGAGDQTPAG
ncbi:hypothetical protein [Hoeflea sp.]|uniref:hypothetical protein n=1 Tax=Hoeflea sp. TaxID=1940281 RepID=UPI003B51F4D0